MTRSHKTAVTPLGRSLGLSLGLSLALSLALAVGAPQALHAQQGWAPTVTPIDAKTEPLPKLRGPARSGPSEDTPTDLPTDKAELPFLPLPFGKEKRNDVTPTAMPEAKSARAEVSPPPAPLETPVARGYCATIGSLAADAKFAWQKKAIAELATDLDDRIARLEEKTAEYKAWLARRDDFSRRVTDNLVVIYSRMRPEAAGQQLTAMDEETAAAVIMKLDPRVASTILNDMNPLVAARLTQIISGAARTAGPAAKPASPAQGPVPAPTAENKKS